ncbi:DUF1697 domain-containing protein [Microbacterium sp. P04]|uniref:DUF1697 domain-containing protein n=1 Tax=Microbacterium sp. P04 TaxID=3366947 RepID=UPI003744D816
MTEWVALLRGVNVGGITIRSAELRALADGLGFTEVRTVLASGNLLFQTDADVSERAALKARIEAALRERFGYDAWILLPTRGELGQAAAGFPFDAADAGRQPWVIFCSDEATREELLAAAEPLDPGVDPVAAGAGVIYWNPVTGSSTDTAFARTIARATFRARTTNRNLRTLQRILS